MFEIVYVVQSKVHGYHSEWEPDQLHVAEEIVEDLNEDLFDKIVVRPCGLEKLTEYEVQSLYLEYADQKYELTKEPWRGPY
jgi:hypothetical protein